MVDIAMCEDKACPSRQSCYRFLARPDEVQTYGDFGRPRDADKCSHYWPAREDQRKPKAGA